MARIAISYRRTDTPFSAGRIYDYFVQQFGAQNIFIDEAFEAGSNWEKALKDHFSECNVLLIVIGKDWLYDENGNNRFDREDDPVFEEIKAVLERPNTLIIPVLVTMPKQLDTEMPNRNTLPPELRRINSFNAHNISANSFNHDIQALKKRIVDYFRSIGSPLPNHNIHGICDVLDEFSYDNFRNRVRTASQRIRLLLTYTQLLNEAKYLFKEAAQERGVEIQVLILDPMPSGKPSLMVEQRNLDVQSGGVGPRFKPNHVLNLINESIDQWEEICGQPKMKGSVELRLYNCMPTFGIYMVDDVAITGFFPYGGSIIHRPMIEVTGLDTRYGKYINEYFNLIWDDKTITRPHCKSK